MWQSTTFALQNKFPLINKIEILQNLYKMDELIKSALSQNNQSKTISIQTANSLQK